MTYAMARFIAKAKAKAMKHSRNIHAIGMLRYDGHVDAFECTYYWPSWCKNRSRSRFDSIYISRSSSTPARSSSRTRMRPANIERTGALCPDNTSIGIDIAVEQYV